MRRASVWARGPSGKEGPRGPARVLRYWAVAALLIGAPACYTARAVPVGSAVAAPGTDVVVRLTPAGAVRLAEASGRTDRVLQGRLQEGAGPSLMLAVPSLEPGRATLGGGLRQVVVIPVADVQEMQVREFSTGRTALLAAGGVGAAVALAAVAFGWADGRSGNVDGPPGDVPFWARLRLTLP